MQGENQTPEIPPLEKSITFKKSSYIVNSSSFPLLFLNSLLNYNKTEVNCKEP
jgi:hypothetical protein